MNNLNLPLTEGKYDPFIFKAIFLAGAPGSGKSTIVDKLHLEAYGLKLCDTDQTLGYLHRMHKVSTIRDEDIEPAYKYAYPIQSRRTTMWVKNYLGLIINGTGRNSALVAGIKNQLEEVGYNTFMIYVDVEKDTALERIGARPKIQGSLTDTNRKVTLDYFYPAFDAVKNNLPIYKTMFQNDFAYVDNDREGNIFHLAAGAKKVRQFLTKPMNQIAKDQLG